MKKKCLFTAYPFDGWHGSMIHICEIAAYLNACGYDCYCAAVSITPIVKNYARSQGLKVYHINELPLDTHYDIVWAYHFPILSTLLYNGLKCGKIHVGSLSSFLPIEMLPPYYNECAFCSVVSQECKDILINDYLLDSTYIHVVPNFLPDKFVQDKKVRKALKNIIVVSNHPPRELYDLPKYLKNINVDFYGQNSIHYKPITPEILSKYDVVISIGKTVQYALGMGIPVYEYDQFGGCGYITTQNYLGEEDFNYSGRATKRKISAKKITTELQEQYDCILPQLTDLKNMAKDRYLLSKNVDIIINQMNSAPDTVIEKSSENLLFFAYSRCLVSYLNQMGTPYSNNSGQIKQTSKTKQYKIFNLPVFKIKTKEKNGLKIKRYYLLGILVFTKHGQIG